MGIFGALYAGVSGLDSQANSIGIISNNISNVNTVGYKENSASFDSLVVPSAVTGAFSPGGAIGTTQQLVNQQGTIAATNSPTDVAISGGGLMFVTSAPLTPGESVNPLYTRAGSFTQDAEGNFVNADGYYLLGLPINPATGNPVANNVQNLKTVNVSASAIGSATPTSSMTLAANFNADQTALLGAGRTVTLSGLNKANNGTDLIIGNDVPGEDTSNGMVRNDSFTITSTDPTTSATTSDAFTYGGFAIGRDINDTSNVTEGTEAAGGGLGDGANALDTETGVTLTGSGGGSTIQVSVANAAAYATSTSVSLSGITTAQATALGVNANQLNGEWKIVSGQGTGTLTLQLASSTVTNGATSTGTVSNRTNNFSGNIMDASNVTDPFLSATDLLSGYTTQALNFSVNVHGVGTSTFTYSTSPDAASGTFDSLTTLASAINADTSSGLTASIVDGRIYVGATDPANTVTFQNGDDTGNAATAVAGSQQNGINWIQELDLPPTITGTANTFNSMTSLANAINTADPNNLTAKVNNPSENATLSINEANAQHTISFSDGNSAVTPAAVNTGGSILSAFGFSTQGTGLTSTGTAADGQQLYTTGVLPETYNPSAGAQYDMSSGAVPAQFTKDITIYDSLGKPHTIAINVSKLDTATATWAVELTAVPASDVVSTNNDGLIAAGTVQFNGAGQITSESGLGTVAINWNPQTIGANPSSISIDLGLTTGSTNSGLTQASGGFNVSSAKQNGSPTGELTGVSINANGFVIASFSNGQTQEMFQVPLANFTNPDGLQAVSGDAYQATLASGTVNPELAGQSGVGTFTPSALEQSNVDLSTQLTNLIIAQQAYGANSKLLTVADNLLQELDQIIS